jgi:CBS domain containing-hemolysin-like protein
VMIFDIFLTLFLVFLNGFFVAAEFAIVKVRSSQLALQAASASKSAAQKIVNNLDGFLAATQLGITLASLGLGWFGEDVATRIILNFMGWIGVEVDHELAHRIALPVAFAFITVLHIVFGELAPKSIAIRYPTPTSLAVSVPLRIFYFIFKPFIKVLNGFANLILKMVGIKAANEHDEIHSEEELRLLVAESEEGGAIESSERELIQNAFDFDDRMVKHVMIPRVKVTGIQVNIPIEDAVKLVLQEGYSRYPVYEKSIDEIIGVVHSKDIIRHCFDKTGKTLKDIVKKAHYVSETKRINELLRDFQKMKFQIAVVISEFGGTIGIVTMEDIIEELVGDIQDEHDLESQIVNRIGDTFQVIATSYISDINRFLDEPLKESEDYETLAGMLLHQRNASLKEGAEFVVEGYKMKILKMNSNLPEMLELKYVRRKENNHA